MDATQEIMNLRLPAGPFVSAKDIAAATGFSQRTILDAIANGKIHGFALNARAKKGEEKITRKSIPRECAIIFMVGIGTFDAESLSSDYIRGLEMFDLHSLVHIQGQLARLIANR